MADNTFRRKNCSYEANDHLTIFSKAVNGNRDLIKN